MKVFLGCLVRLGGAVVLVAACSTEQDKLLGVDLAGTITSGTVTTPAAADALRIGAVAALNSITATGAANNAGTANTPWVFTDLFTDVWQTADARNQTVTWDQRVISNTDAETAVIYNNLHVARARSAEAIAALKKYKPLPAWGIGQMYWALGVAEMELGEYFCNGVPLSTSEGGVITYSLQLTSQQVLSSASAHLDTAMTFLTESDTSAVSLLNAAKVTKGRVLVDLGQFAAGATAVAGVQTGFAYRELFNLTSGDNIVWQVNTSNRRMVVGDSVAQVTDGNTVFTIANAIPFAQARDPRVPVTGTTLGTSPLGKGNDTKTNVVLQGIWTGRSDAVNIVSGLDARLIEAEAALNANDLSGMTTILNALRASPPALSASLTPAPMTPLAVPATKDAAVSLLFREKAFWTFGRGQRFGDLRRLVRQYGRAQGQVYPTGTFFRSSTPYGSDMVLEIPIGESNNPLVKANGSSYCLDKNP